MSAVLTPQVEELGVRTVWSVLVVHEGIVNQFQLLVHHRNPADALWDLAVDWGEHRSLSVAVECKKPSRVTKSNRGGEMLSTACVWGKSAVIFSTAASATVVFDNFGHERRPAVDVDHVVRGNCVDNHLALVLELDYQSIGCEMLWDGVHPLYQCLALSRVQSCQSPSSSCRWCERFVRLPFTLQMAKAEVVCGDISGMDTRYRNGY
jgi:hypothetical protein